MWSSSLILQSCYPSGQSQVLLVSHLVVNRLRVGDIFIMTAGTTALKRNELLDEVAKEGL